MVWETKARSIAKAFTYRFSGMIFTAILIWVLTGRIDWAAYGSAADTLIKAILFYFHERIWQKIPFGIDHIEYEI